MRTATSYSKVFSKMMWFMALLLVVFSAGCDREQGTTGGTGTVPGTGESSLAAGHLGAALPYGGFGGTAGMTNSGIQTVVQGDYGTTQTAPTGVTGLHDSAGDIYTEVLGSDVGSVTGKLYTCTHSTTGPTSVAANPVSCVIADDALLAAQAAYTRLSPAQLPGGTDPSLAGGQLGSLTLAPGVYTTATSFQITGLTGADDLTLDAQGDPNASWVFQMGSTLTVGGASLAESRTVHLINGAQAKNVFWQVGSSATINPAGGGTMVGNIIAQTAITFSTVGSVTVVTLNGRALSLTAGVTTNDTVINLP
jgi:hypothetical protein